MDGLGSGGWWVWVWVSVWEEEGGRRDGFPGRCDGRRALVQNAYTTHMTFVWALCAPSISAYLLMYVHMCVRRYARTHVWLSVCGYVGVYVCRGVCG